MLTKKEKKATVARIGVLIFCYVLGAVVGQVGEKAIEKYILEEEN